MEESKVDGPRVDEPSAASGGRVGARSLHPWLVAAGAALGLMLAGLGVAVAQTGGSPPAPDPNVQAGDEGPRPGGRSRHGGKGMGRGIHGEFVTRAPAGGYQTIANQMGEVTEVSASSIAVRSEDGFARTYAVDDSTLVNAGNQGIADVKKGDQVHVTAVVREGRASAVQIRDATQVRQLRDRWAPPRPNRPASP